MASEAEVCDNYCKEDCTKSETNNNNKSNGAKNNTSQANKCSVCKEDAVKYCSACKSVFYCSIEHQKQDWKQHRKNCKCYIIESNEKYGRYVVASRDIEPGTVIMKEEPIMCGPNQDSLPICLGCHKLLMISGTKYYCSKCTFPLCKAACEKMPIHAENECKLFSKFNPPLFPKITNFKEAAHPIYECILTLRLLNLKKSNPTKWKQLIQMTHQNENRQKVLPSLWYRNQKNTVQTLLKVFKGEFTELDIHTAIGYIDINAFEVKVHGYEISGLFNNTYLMSHDCLSNTHHIMTEDHMVVRASVPIKKGQQITTIYVSIMDGTLNRNNNLIDSKFFLCTCTRCSDPTELGTYSSAIKCNNNPNCSGKDTAYFLPKNPLDLKSDWICNECSSIKSVDNITKITDLIQEEIKIEGESNSTPPNISNLEAMLKKYEKKVLHPNHYLILQILHSLVSFYGRINGSLIHELDLTQLKRMEEICLHLLRILDVIEPGLQRLRGFTLYQLHAAIYFKSQQEYQNGLIGKSQLNERLMKILELLKESNIILNFDGENTPEGQIAKTIPRIIADVEKCLMLNAK